MHLSQQIVIPVHMLASKHCQGVPMSTLYAHTGDDPVMYCYRKEQARPEANRRRKFTEHYTCVTSSYFEAWVA